MYFWLSIDNDCNVSELENKARLIVILLQSVSLSKFKFSLMTFSNLLIILPQKINVYVNHIYIIATDELIIYPILSRGFPVLYYLLFICKICEIGIEGIPIFYTWSTVVLASMLMRLVELLFSTKKGWPQIFLNKTSSKP